MTFDPFPTSQEMPLSQELGTLYELALASGASLDLLEVCERFLETLMRTQPLGSAAIWIRREAANAAVPSLPCATAIPMPLEDGTRSEPQSSDFVQLLSLPSPRATDQAVEETRPVAKTTLEEGRMVLSAEEIRTRVGGHTPEVARYLEQDAEWTFLKLGDLGMLQMSSPKVGFLSERRGRQLKPVLDKLTVSISAALAFANTQREMAQRAKAQQAVQSANQMMQARSDHLPVGVLVEDQNHQIVSANPAFCRIFESGHEPKELIGWDCNRSSREVSLLLEDPEAFMAHRQQCFNDGDPKLQNLITSKHGRSYLQDYVPLELGDGHRGHLWQYLDITERVESVKERDRLSLVAKNTQNGVIICSPHGEIEWVNQGFTDNTGYDLEEIVGKRPKDFLQGPLTSPEVVEQMSGALKEHRPFEGQLANYDKFGQVFFINLSITPIISESGDLTGFTAIQSDITTEKMAQDAVRREEQRHSLLLENALDGFVSIDSNGMVTAWNPQAQDIFGWTEEEVLGTRLSEKIIPERLREAHENGLKRFAETGEGPVLNQRIEIDGLRKGGEEFPLELTIYPIPQDDSTSFSAFVRDISERKSMEKMKDDLVANVSHELRTPLTSLQGFVELLMNRDYEREKQQQFLKIIHDETLRLTRLVSDFLDIQRMENGKLDYRFEELDLSTLVKEMVTVFSTDHSDQQIEIDVPPDFPTISADADRVRQVLANLFSNAVKFSTEKKPIFVALQDHGPVVRLTVKDQGIGIPKESIPHLFEKFYRVEEADALAIGGSGLGLSVTQQIVDSHGGEIYVESEPGEGSSFTVTLPKTRDA